MNMPLTWPIILGIGLGGALGAVVRLLLDRYLPFGILLANTLGCAILGFLFGEMSAVDPQTYELLGTGAVSPALLTVLTFGLVGALSTFSTVSLNAAQLWMSGWWIHAAGLWGLHLVCGLLAGAVGFALSAAWGG